MNVMLYCYLMIMLLLVLVPMLLLVVLLGDGDGDDDAAKILLKYPTNLFLLVSTRQLVG